jgi:transcription antitermination factor NusG
MGKQWIILKTQPRRELRACGALAARGVECYVPTLPPRGSRPQELMFPGYAFARVDSQADDVLRARSAPGIAYALPRDAPPTLLPDGFIAALRARASDPSGSLLPGRGERVTIVAGPFRWVEALFDRRLNAAGRVRVLLQLVHGSMAVDIDEAQLRWAK